MTSGQIFALVWGPFALIFGTMFILKRDLISRVARRQRELQGQRITPRTQSPALMAVGGAFFAIAGVCVFIGGLTGALR